MMEPLLATLLLFPLCLLIREPFRRLPLHIDTGFYVSNDAIAAGRWDFRRGWNAHYAGGSKLVPEAFFTHIYLLARRLGGDAGQVAGRYISGSRLGVSAVNYASAVLVGWFACVLADGDIRLYYAGLCCYALLSSEPHYGGAFECAEVFEIPFQLLAMLALAVAVQIESPALIALSALAFAAEACFVKLSSAVGCVVLYAAVSAMSPWTAAPAILGGGAALALYAGWLLWLGRRPAQWLAPLKGHEASFSRQGSGLRPWQRLKEKSLTFWGAVRRQPVIPLLMLAALLAGRSPHPLLALYGVATLATYMGQSTDCRYYLLPILPPMAVLAAFGVSDLLRLGMGGAAVAVIGAILWLVLTPMRAARMNDVARNRWVWGGSRSAAQADENVQLARFADRIRPIVGSGSMLVYGAHNQAYVLTGTAWATPLVAPEHYLDDVCPGWQKTLNAELVARPPDFILDTDRCFDVEAARQGLGLSYVAADEAASMRLYRLVGRRNTASPPALIRTFRALSVGEWRQWSGTAPGEADRPVEMSATELGADPHRDELHRLLNELKSRGCRGIAVYGAGRFTIRHADCFRASPVPVCVVLDDDPRPDERGYFLDWPVVRPDQARSFAIDAIVLSTDRFAGAMRRRLVKLGLGDLCSRDSAGGIS